jgi:hypothetical protein
MDDTRPILAGQHQDAVLSVGWPRHDTSTNAMRSSGLAD